MAEHSFGRANQKFTVADWRALFGAEPGIVGDVDGSAYKLTLPTGTDDAVLGSTTQDSTSVVGGALHQIAAGQTQTVTIPASTNVAAGRTDLIVVRYDAATYTTDPGPCRLYRVAGVEGSTALPTLDEAPPGVEDMPLWAVTRKQGQSLNQAASRWLGRRIGPNLLTPAGASLPPNVPLGTRTRRGDEVYERVMGSTQPEWTTVFGTTPYTALTGYAVHDQGPLLLLVEGKKVTAFGSVKRTASGGAFTAGAAFGVASIPIDLRPGSPRHLGAVGGYSGPGWARYTGDGQIKIAYASNGTMPTSPSNPWFVALDGLTWMIP